MIEDQPYVVVSNALINWQVKMSGPANSAVILSTIKNIYKNKNQLKVIDSDGCMKIRTKFLESCIYHSIGQKMITRSLSWLNDMKVIDYKNDHHYLYIKINFDKISEIEDLYFIESKNKFFLIYFFAVNFGVRVSPKSVLIPIMLSKFLYEVEKEIFVSEMSIPYIHKKFCGIFTEQQEQYAKNILIKHNFLAERTKAYIDDGDFGRKRYYTVQVDEIKKEIKNNFIGKSKKETKYKKIQKTQSRDHVNSGSYITKDKLKSDSYTQEEKELFRRQAEELTAAGEQWIF